MIEDAGRERVPFTTGILVGIGETLRDRAESLVALRDAHERHGHVQEVIVQNFRAKPRTAMQGAPDAALLEYVAAVAVARLVMGPRMRIQVPPNLSDPAEFDLLVRAGADDWGGVSPLTADHVNPERPWPHLDDLAARTAELGFELRERLTAHPEFVARRRDLDRPGAARRRRGARRPRDRAWRGTVAAAELLDVASRRRRIAPPSRSRRADLEEFGRRRSAPATSRRASAASPRPRHPTRSPSTTPSGSRCSRRPATTSTRSPRPPTTCAATPWARR